MLLLKTQTRLLILTAAIVVLFLGGMAVIQTHDRVRATAILEEIKRDKTTLLRELFSLRGETLRTFAFDYTYWDEMVDFVNTGDSTWAIENIGAALETYHADRAWVFTPEGRLVYATASDSGVLFDSLLLPDTLVLSMIRRQPFGHYFYLADTLLFEFRTAPIQPSSDLDRTSTPRGHFATAKLWTPEFLASVGTIAGAELTLDVDPTSVGRQSLNHTDSIDHLNLSIPVSGTNGAPLARIRARVEAAAVASFHDSFRMIQIYVWTFGGAILALLSLLLYQWVSQPLALISRCLEKRDLTLIRDLQRAGSEFGQIARLITSFFQQQSTLEAEVQERRRTEQALTESDYRYRIISEQTGQVVYDWNVLTGSIYWAGAIESITGYSTEAYQQIDITAWEQLIHPDDRARAKELLDHAAIHNGKYNVEYRLRRLDGSYIYVEDNGIFLVNPVGAVVRMLGTMSDISGRKAAEQAIIESERRFRLLFERATDAALLITDQIVDCNEKSCELWGVPREQLIGRSPAELSPEYQPDGRLSTESAAARIQASRAGEQQFFYWRHCHSDGTPLECEVSLQAIELNESTLIHATVRNIGERMRAQEAIRQNEARLRTLVESLPHRIALKNRESVYVVVNESFAQHYGRRAADIVGQTDYDLLPAESAEREQLDDLSILTTGQTRESEQESTESGETRVRHTTKVAVRDDHGAVTGVLVVISDFSERRRLERALLQSQKMEAVGRLAGGVAHDFNNLLTVITSYTQLLMDDLPADGDAYSSIEEIKKAADRASNLTRQLLAFSRRSISEPKNLVLNAIITDMEKMFRRLIGEDIDMTMRLDRELWGIYADAGHIEQILTNLVVNARDAMPHGGKLAVATYNRDVSIEQHDCTGAPIRPGSYVTLEVSDTGVGIPPEIKARIFEPFFTTKETGKGTGLGLATVFGIVNQSSGYLQVDSTPGIGTTFRLFLPRIGETSLAEAPKARIPLHTGVAAGKSVLLVEDEDSVRTVASRILMQYGFTVTAVPGGTQAIQEAQRPDAQFDLVLTDVVMPGMNGKAVATEIQRLLPGIKIAYMSGYTDEAIVHHGVLEDGINFIRKPFAREDLIGKVLEALES